jgi:hypothetical protein
MSDRADPDASHSLRQAVEEGQIIVRQNPLTDEERHRLVTDILINRSCGELLRNAVVDEEEGDEKGASDE